MTVSELISELLKAPQDAEALMVVYDVDTAPIQSVRYEEAVSTLGGPEYGRFVVIGQ